MSKPKTEIQPPKIGAVRLDFYIDSQCIRISCEHCRQYLNVEKSILKKLDKTIDEICVAFVGSHLHLQ